MKDFAGHMSVIIEKDNAGLWYVWIGFIPASNENDNFTFFRMRNLQSKEIAEDVANCWLDEHRN